MVRPSAEREVLERLTLVAAEVVEGLRQPLDLDAPISEAGIDSVNLAEIVGRMEEAFEIALPAQEWLSVRTLRDFVEVVARARRQATGPGGAAG